MAGPYPRDNATIVLDLEGAGGKSAHWEGTAMDQGDDSFFPWRLENGTWVGFFGVHDKTGDTGGKVRPPLSLLSATSLGLLIDSIRLHNAAAY